MNNANVILLGKTVRLVPYLRHHVTQYHRWMCDPELLHLTCSEPLTLEEEFLNQTQWLVSSDKLTFIVMIDKPLASRLGWKEPDGAVVHVVSGGVGISLCEEELVMIGDCNLFVSPFSEGDESEVEVMIAEKWARERGFGQEALSLLVLYAANALGRQKFVAKILKSNEPSRRLFEKLGFSLFKEVNVFDELHFERTWSEKEFAELEERVGFTMLPYESQRIKEIVPA
jgi:RimJ/RimL family protein N-acetyltransferase